eukprot:m.176615 g.176615  ORF g.176615 m.176615 type:complete len:63 (+) comp53354_c0_seq1:322-510(+)
MMNTRDVSDVHHGDGVVSASIDRGATKLTYHESADYESLLIFLQCPFLFISGAVRGSASFKR